ncbi:MAG TPA: DinB family protein [Vicinamibacteria bacterium]|nr:DinB family protein [Vicinamibacteria bacterium]
MQSALDGLCSELEQEAETTLRVLQRVPRDGFDWRPHPRSMTLGELALHVARIPADFSRILEGDGVDFAEADFGGPGPTAETDLQRELRDSLAAARAWLAGLDSGKATATWSARSGGQLLFAVPRVALVRSLMFNHLYHHRGQLCLYLRLLEVPVPPVYGPTADENPFR